MGLFLLVHLRGTGGRLVDRPLPDSVPGQGGEQGTREPAAGGRPGVTGCLVRQCRCPGGGQGTRGRPGVPV